MDNKYLTLNTSTPETTRGTFTDATDWSWWSQNCNGVYYHYQKVAESLERLIDPKKEGIEMKGLYEVIGVYGENRDNVIFHRPEKSFVIASSEEDAKMKSGIYGWIDEKWDADYLTIIVRKIGDVAVKEKPKEVKSV